MSATIGGIREIVPGGVLRTQGKIDFGDGKDGWYIGHLDDGVYFELADGGGYVRRSPSGGLEIAGDGSGITQIDGGNIKAGTITAAQIASGTITADEIATGTITADEIATGTITADEIATGTIRTENLEVGAVTLEKLGIGLVSGNLIGNAGFEAGETAPHELIGDGWSLVTSPVRGGSYALRHDPSGQSSTEYCNFNGPVDAGVAKHQTVVPGRSYLFEFWVRRPATGAAWNQIRAYWSWRAADGSQISQNYKTFTPADFVADTWTLCSDAKRAPDNAVYVVFRIAVLSQGGDGLLYFDDALAQSQVDARSIEVDSIGAEHIQAASIDATKLNVSELASVSQVTGDLDITGTLEIKTNAYLFGSNPSGQELWRLDQYGLVLRDRGEDSNLITWKADSGELRHECGISNDGASILYRNGTVGPRGFYVFGDYSASGGGIYESDVSEARLRLYARAGEAPSAALQLLRGSLMTWSDALKVDHDGSGVRIGFYGAPVVAQQTVSGSRGGNAALTSLLSALENLGLIVDSTT